MKQYVDRYQLTRRSSGAALRGQKEGSEEADEADEAKDDAMEQ